MPYSKKYISINLMEDVEMQRSFYEFLMSKRDSNSTDEVAQFANKASVDESFPKQSEDFDEISEYLELQATYIESMTVFDKAWTQYLAEDGQHI